MTLDELKLQEKELRAKLDANLKLQKKITDAEFCQQWGIDIGDDLEWPSGGKTLKGKIASIDMLFFIATLYNADGSLGKKTTHVYNLRKGNYKVTKPQ